MERTKVLTITSVGEFIIVISEFIKIIAEFIKVMHICMKVYWVGDSQVNMLLKLFLTHFHVAWVGSRPDPTVVSENYKSLSFWVENFLLFKGRV